MDSCAGSQVDFTVAGHRPHEAATFQPFGKQTQAVPVCPENLYHVAATAAEDKKMAAERVGAQCVLYFRCQPVEATAHICYASNQPDTRTCRKTNHEPPSLSSMISARRSSGVNGPVWLRLPPGNVSLQLITGGISVDTTPFCLGGGVTGSIVIGISAADPVAPDDADCAS